MNSIPISFPLWWQVEKHGISYSMLEDWMTCRQKAWFRINGIRPMGVAEPLIYGSIVHSILSRIHKFVKEQHGVPKRELVEKWVEESHEEWVAKNPRSSAQALEIAELSTLQASAIMPQYVKHWEKDLLRFKWITIEELVKAPFNGTTINAIIDALTEDRKDQLWLHEHKTHSRISEGTLVDRIHFANQTLIYALVVQILYNRIPKGVYYNVVRRPSIKPKKGQPLNVFAKRLEEDVAERPDFYFVRFEVEIDEEDVARLSRELQTAIGEIQVWQTGSTHYRNTSQCEGKYGACPFLKICGNNDWTGYVKGSK